MRKKIRLINPSNSKHSLRGVHYEGFASALYPSYGLLVIASVTPLKYDIEYIDESIIDYKHDLNVDIVGLTVTTSKSERAYEIADWYRRHEIPIILGGIHVSSVPAEAKSHADAIVIGEGEKVWPKILNDIENKSLEPLYKSSRLVNINTLPGIDWKYVDKERYQRPYILETSRGCPYNCEYCCSKYFGKKYRNKTGEKIKEELQNIDFNQISFVDDNIIGDFQRAKDLFYNIGQSGKYWTAQSTIEIAYEDALLEIAFKNGCRILVIGIDTINRKNFNISNKIVNLKYSCEDAIKRIQDIGIKVVANFIFGFDEDDEGIFEQTVKYCEKNNIHAPFYWILTPYPNTNLYKRLCNENRIIEYGWDKYDSRHVVFKPKKMTPEKLFEGFNRAYSETYSKKSITKRVSCENIADDRLKFNLFINKMHENGIYYYIE